MIIEENVRFVNDSLLLSEREYSNFEIESWLYLMPTLTRNSKLACHNDFLKFKTAFLSNYVNRDIHESLYSGIVNESIAKNLRAIEFKAYLSLVR